MKYTFRLAAAAAIVFSITACTDKPSPDDKASTDKAPAPVATTSSAALQQQEPPRVTMRTIPAAEPNTDVSRSPHLRNIMPENAYAYARIPNPWGLLSQPKGSIFDKATASKPFVEATESLRSGLNKNILVDIPEKDRYLLGLLLVHARSPLEASLLSSAKQGFPFPDLLLSLALDFKDIPAFNAYLKQLSQSMSSLGLPTELDAQGLASMQFAGFPAQLYFDVKDQRLYLFAGQSADAQKLADLIHKDQANPSHPMHRLEESIDSGGQGMFMWIDPQPMLKTLEATGKAQQAAMLKAMGATEMKGLAMGFGVSSGKQRVKLLLEMPMAGFRSFLHQVDVDVQVNAAGKLDTVLMFSLPDVEGFQNIEKAFAGMTPPSKMEEYKKNKEKLRTSLGFGPEDLLATLGSEVMVLFDEAGQYGAIKLRDRQRFLDLMETLKSQHELQMEERTIAGATIHHLVIPWPMELPEQDADPEKQGLQRIFGRMLSLPSHIFWMEEDGYLLLASVPQVLMDRRYIQARTPVKEWLQKQQGVDPKGALLLGSSRSKGLPALMYDMSLSLILSLGDFVGQPVDIFSLPSARELQLPEEGGYGLQIDSTATELSMELSYEHDPMELLMVGGGGMQTVAVVGILAAVAIPAYQDYTIRARLIEGITLGRQVSTQIEQFYAVNERFPTEEEAQEMLPAQLPQEVEDIFMDSSNSRVIVAYSIDQLGQDNQLYLSRQEQDGGATWKCSADIYDKYLPTSCRP